MKRKRAKMGSGLVLRGERREESGPAVPVVGPALEEAS